MCETISGGIWEVFGGKIKENYPEKIRKINETSTFFMKTRGNWLNPGHEPILLDLEKLFLLSDSMANEDF